MKKKISTNNIETVISDAKFWVMESGIQNKDLDPQINGSYNAWYDSDTGEYSYLYSEITGYFITLMCYFYNISKDNRYLINGENAANWLLNTTYEINGAFRCLFTKGRPSKYDHKHNEMYSFDNGVIVNGLVNLFRLTKKEKYLAAAITTSDWLIQTAQTQAGLFQPVYDIDDGRFFESDKEWSMSSGSYHVKIAIGLLNLYDLTENKRYLNAATKVCDITLGYQLTSGRYISFLSKGGTNVHPHCYTAEGLWVAGKFLKRDDYLDSSAKGIKWLLDLQNSDGVIPRLYFDDKPVYHERIDAIAQTIRMAIIHIVEKRLDSCYYSHIEKLISLMLKYQVKEGNKHELGGIYWGKTSNGKIMGHPNSWVTAFSIQALMIHEDYLENNKLDLNLFHIV